MHACVLNCFGHVQFFVTLWTVADQAPLSMGFFQARILRVAMPSSRGSLQPRDQTHVSYVSFIDMWTLHTFLSGKLPNTDSLVLLVS